MEFLLHGYGGGRGCWVQNSQGLQYGALILQNFTCIKDLWNNWTNYNSCKKTAGFILTQLYKIAKKNIKK